MALNPSGLEATDTPLPEPVLHVSDVWKRFGNHEALRGISFDIQPSERVALLGPNGAGKTTLVRSICGRVKLNRGNVAIQGIPITNASAMKRLGVIPQDLAIYPDLSAKDNLECFGRLHGLSGQLLRNRIEWALDWIGLTERAKDLTREFSGGMKRRVNIACGVLHRPRILLLDEPTVGVDPQSRQRIFDMLDELHSHGTSIVLTTHHLDEAEQRCDRIIIVDHGKVIAQGTLAEIIETTIGNSRTVYITAQGPFVAVPRDVQWNATTNQFSAVIDDVATELPLLLQRIQRVGGTILDLSVHRPNLHDVFLHLTGKELRE